MSRAAGTRWRPQGRDERLLAVALVGGFFSGLLVTIFHDRLPEQFNRDANRIYGIASGAMGDYADQSYTPVGLIYRFLLLGESPLAAGLFGYFVATFAIVLAVLRAGRRTASWPTAALVFGAFVLSAVYLGQYSKDLFVLFPVMLLVLLPRAAMWDLLGLAGMGLYAFFFRDYWFLILITYVGYRVLSLRQVRLRYLLLAGSLAAVLGGLGFYLLMGLDPNHFRTVVQDHLHANTEIIPLVPLPQPSGGLVDVFLNYWLLFAPVILLVTAGIAYLPIIVGFSFLKVWPLLTARSSRRWPPIRSLDGALVRRALSLLLATAVVQALFEPDYGSALRHVTPLMPLMIVLVQSMRSGSRRVEPSASWSWSGAGVSRGINGDV
ncbi:hypothetical protein ACH0AH_08910 [Microbacterium paludicola]|uniref:hypothetical protein n=1 Tax=Microbacterium paludicola TaxID=300019 RepID=UPI003879C486